MFVVVHRGRAVLPPVLALLVAASLVAASAPSGSAHPVAHPRGQELALLLAAHTARSAPSSHSARVEVVEMRRPLTAERTALPVTAHATGAGGVKWLHVLLPGRPNGHAGWIMRRATAHAVTTWRIVVDTSTRRVTVFDNDRRARTFKAVVGKPSTPTPRGNFFVEESIALRPTDVGGPFALALSARSDVYQEFDGGPGQIALHGLSNVGGVLGTAASHGCVRLDDAAMRWLAVRIGPGVPVTITG